MRVSLLLAGSVLILGLGTALSLAVLYDLAAVAPILVGICLAGSSALIGYGLASCNLRELVAKVGRHELRMQLITPDADQLDPDLLAELHDFGCHILRHREVPPWRRALLQLDQRTTIEPSLQPRATAAVESPPAQPRAAVMSCDGCAKPGATARKVEDTVLLLCDSCAAKYQDPVPSA